MDFLRIALIITTIIVSLSTRIQAQINSTEPKMNEPNSPQGSSPENPFETYFGSGLNCPLEIVTKYRDCNGEASKQIRTDNPNKPPTPAQLCSYYDDIVKCNGAALENCKSQKARFVKEIAKNVVKQSVATRVDCKAFTFKNDPDGPKCSELDSISDCADLASNIVSSEVDYTDKKTFAQHCRNRNDIIKCINNATDTCKSPLALEFKAGLVKSTQKAYKRFGCDGAPSSASASIIIVLGSVLLLPLFKLSTE